MAAPAAAAAAAAAAPSSFHRCAAAWTAWALGRSGNIGSRWQHQQLHGRELPRVTPACCACWLAQAVIRAETAPIWRLAASGSALSHAVRCLREARSRAQGMAGAAGSRSHCRSTLTSQAEPARSPKPPSHWRPPGTAGDWRRTEPHGRRHGPSNAPAPSTPTLWRAS
jgi:hypothetical protein